MFDRAESSVWACGWSRNLSSIDHLVPAWFATRLNLHFFACDLSNITIIEPKFVPCRQSVFHIFKIRVPVLTVEMWFCVLSDLVERPTIYQDCQCGHTILILARLFCSVFWYFLYVPALICYLAIRLSNRLVVCGTSYLRFNWLSSGERTLCWLFSCIHAFYTWLRLQFTGGTYGSQWKAKQTFDWVLICLWSEMSSRYVSSSNFRASNVQNTSHGRNPQLLVSLLADHAYQLREWKFIENEVTWDCIDRLVRSQSW